MTPEGFVQNVTGIVQAVLTPLGPLALAVGTTAFVAGKLADNPGWTAWGRRGWMGAAVAFAANAVGAIIQNIAQRAGGGAGGA
jgi:hypothetical protein